MQPASSLNRAKNRRKFGWSTRVQCIPWCIRSQLWATCYRSIRWKLTLPTMSSLKQPDVAISRGRWRRFAGHTIMFSLILFVPKLRRNLLLVAQFARVVDPITFNSLKCGRQRIQLDHRQAYRQKVCFGSTWLQQSTITMLQPQMRSFHATRMQFVLMEPSTDTLATMDST